MTDDATKLARENIDAFNAGDWQRFKATLASDSVYSELATQRSVRGPDEIAAISQGWRSAFPDAKGTVTNAIGTGDQATIELTWEGTQTGDLVGPMGTIPATGRRVKIPAVQVVRAAGGKLTETRHYFDLMGMLQQLGAMPAAAQR